MKYFVKWEVFDTISEQGMVGMKDAFAKQLEHVEKSGKLMDGGTLLGIRGGYFVFDIEEPAELLDLLGSVIWDNCHIESFPVISFKEISEYLKKTELKKAA
jgi:hypothetical protein